MKSNFILKANRLINNAGLQLKKHSPEILMVAGIAGTIASTVMACKATLKVNEILEEKNENIKNINTVFESSEYDYTEEDKNKDLTIVYAQTGVKLLKLYAPAIGLGILSIGAIVAGHNILKKRNIALAAAYAVVDKGFKDYRKNVVDRFGNDIDKELRYNIKAKEIEVEETDDKGKKTTKKEVLNVVGGNVSDYSKFFDEMSTQYHKDAEYNLMFLRRQQDWANEKLKSKGHLFLNEVYDMLGIPRTKAGQIVGWIYDEKNPIGDNYVDFGIYNNNEINRAFINGYEKAILLDFNVDGPIYDLI